ncbi:hypothetical protein HK100_003303, partial [Physocladia obscura]
MSAALCTTGVPNYNPFLVNGARTAGSAWELPPASQLRPLNMTDGRRAGYGCFACPNSAVGIPMLAADVASALAASPAAAFDAATLCPPGFFCPYLDAADLATYPVYCPPDAACLALRLGTASKCATPQGYYEPMACPKGFYCPSYNEVYVCPSGSFCLTGSIAPTKCQFLSYCPVGIDEELHFGLLAIVVIFDIFLLAVYIFFRVRELRNNNEPLSAALPEILRKFFWKRSISFVKIPKGSPEPTQSKTASSSTVSVPSAAIAIEATTSAAFSKQQDESIAVVSTKLSTAAAISQNISVLTSGFKKGLEGHDDLRMNYQFSALGLRLSSGKEILKGVSGEIKSGRMTAIMGPSGAGKTTFMNVLMGKVSRTDGTLRINNVVAEMQTYRKIIGYVPQDDVMIPELTVRENLLYSARTRLPQSWTSQEIEEHVDSLLKALNLAHVANSRIGSTLIRGISGGQRKRVNIGLELAAVPLSIYLDEPTSGLDSTAALDVVNIMSSISRLGLTIVAVIHQPRLEIFEAFDDVLMIAPGGLTAYMGPVDRVQEYFASLGFVFDERLNPADVLMDILSGRGELAPGVPYDRQNVDSIVEEWKIHASKTSTTESATAKEPANEDKDAIQAMSSISKLRGTSFLHQIVLAHNRSLLQQMRLVSSFVMEAFLGALAGFMMGLAVPAGESYQGIYVSPFSAISGSQNATFLGIVNMINGIVIALVAAPPGVKVFGEEMAVYYREAAAGHDKLAYFIGKNLSIVYRIALASAHFVAVYYLMAHPPIYLGVQYVAVLLNFFGIYGMSMIVSMFIRRENAPLMAVTVGMIFGVLCGFAPSIIAATKQGYIFLFDIGMNRWASEMTFETSTLTAGILAFYKREMTLAVNYLRRAAFDERETSYNVLAIKLYVQCFVMVSELKAANFKVLRREICDLNFILSIAWDDTRYPLTRVIAAEAAGCIKYVEECYCESFDLFRLVRSLTVNLRNRKPTSKEIIQFQMVGERNGIAKILTFVSEPTAAVNLEYFRRCDGNISMLEPMAQASRSRIQSFMSDSMAKIELDGVANASFQLWKIVDEITAKDGIAFLNSDTPLYNKFLKKLERAATSVDALTQRITAVFCRAVLFFRLRDLENSARKFRQLITILPGWNPEAGAHNELIAYAIIFLSFFEEPAKFKEIIPQEKPYQYIVQKENLFPTQKKSLSSSSSCDP